jgi:hypothetical protein
MSASSSSFRIADRSTSALAMASSAPLLVLKGPTKRRPSGMTAIRSRLRLRSSV